MKLRLKLTLFLLLVTLGPAVVLGLATTRLIERATARSVQEMLEHNLQVAWDEYWGRSEQVRLGMLQTVADPSVQALVDRRDGVALSKRVRIWQDHHPDVDFWLVTDAAGGEITRLTPAPAAGLLSFDSLIGTAVERLERQQPLLFSEILSPEIPAGENAPTPPPGGTLAIVAVIPVRCAGVGCGLIIVGDLVDNDSYVPDSVRERVHGHLEHTALTGELHGPIVFISHDGAIVATSLRRPDGGLALGDAWPGAVMTQVRAGTPYQGTLALHGVSFLIDMEPIRNGRNLVIGNLSVGMPQHFWLVHGEAIQAVVVSLLLGIGLAAGAATLLGARVARPLQELTTKAQAFAAGDLAVRVPATGADEIGELGQAFNHMAQQLQESYGRLDEERRKALAAIDASVDGIWVDYAVGDERQIAMVNSALERMTRRRRDNLIGRPCKYLLGVRTAQGESICDTVCPFLHPDEEALGTIEGVIATTQGEEIPIEVGYGCIRDKDGHLVGAVHVVRDLTPRKEVERLKDEFISMVSHELRTPLHHIKGFTTTLLQTDVEWDAASQSDFLGSINREADRLTHLVENILDMSRLEAGQVPLRKACCGVVDLVEGALQRLQSLTTGRPIHLKLADDLPALWVDDREIELVLINLIENAVKYSEPGTPITLGAERRGDEIVFSVANCGRGIPAEHLARIFERFYRVNGGGRPVAGTGLGLAICKRIVEAHGGRIWAESTPGVGPCFSFTLPLTGDEG